MENNTDLMQTLVPALTSLLIAALTALATFLANLIRAKTKNSYLRGALVRLDDAVFTAVKMVAQTYADAIKDASADGVLTDEEKYTAKQKAISAAKLYLGPTGLAELVKVLGVSDADTFLGMKVEAAVADMKAVPPKP